MASYIESKFSLLSLLLLQKLSLKMRAKIVTESCSRIIFESSKNISSQAKFRHDVSTKRINFGQNHSDFKSFGETTKFIATNMYICPALSGAANYRHFFFVKGPAAEATDAPQP